MTTLEKATRRLKKIGLTDTLAQTLAAKGVLSVMHLAMLPTSKLKEHINGTDLGDDTIESIQKRASTLKAIVDHYYVTVRAQVSPYNKALASTNVNNNIINFHQGLESYPEMFGSQDYANCPEFDSVLSPAAYLVDLMRYIKQYVNHDVPEDSPLLLSKRRPDIGEIPLNLEETITEYPYLQIVNEILIIKIAKDNPTIIGLLADATDKEIEEAISNMSFQEIQYYVMQTMAESVYPFDLPFNMPLQEIRSYLEALKTELYDVYNTFNASESAQNREYIKLAPEQVNYLSKKLSDSDNLNDAYGYIETPNPNPHFTGVVDDSDLGSLNNADIFINQVGFTDTSQLKDLLYQNIKKDEPGTDQLLNDLFINKTNNGKHLSLKPVPDLGPKWSDSGVWKDPSYYETAQQVVLNDTLYMIVRASGGIDTWKYNTQYQKWYQVSSKNPNWDDAHGWNQAPYYTTIQTNIVKDHNSGSDILLLFGRSKSGIQTYFFDENTNTWTNLSGDDPAWSDPAWSNPAYYSTIQTVVIEDKLYLLGRSKDGIQMYQLTVIMGNMPIYSWKQISTNNPPWKDDEWWEKSNYATIQTAVMGNNIFLIGRKSTGIETWVIDTTATAPAWSLVKSNYPEWSNANNWDLESSYATIQVVAARDVSLIDQEVLYLIGRTAEGIEMYELKTSEVMPTDPPTYDWHAIPPSINQPFTNKDKWNLKEQYATIQLVKVTQFFFFDCLFLIGRSAKGIEVWLYNYLYKDWILCDQYVPGWSDVTGWGEPGYYETIQTAIVPNAKKFWLNDFYLLGCTSEGIMTWKQRTPKIEIDGINPKNWHLIFEIDWSFTKELPIRSVIDQLDMTNLDVLNRFIRLANLLDWSFEDLDWVLQTLKAKTISAPGISSISQINQVMDTLKITAQQATVFWHDIKTTGIGSGTISLAQFDQIFNEPTLFLEKARDKTPKAYHPLYTPNPNYKDDVLPWNPADTTDEQNNKITQRIMAAINLDAINLKALVKLLFEKFKTTIKLDVPNLSKLYRYALLSNTLQLSIDELVILFKLLNIEAQENTFTLDQIAEIVTTNNWIKSNNLNLFDLQYICLNKLDKSVDNGFDIKKVPDFLKTLSDASKAWGLKYNLLTFGSLMSKPLSKTLYNTLLTLDYVDGRGILLKNNFSFPEVSDLIECDALKYTQKNLLSVYNAGKTEKDAASRITMKLSNNEAKSLSDGALSVWFKNTDAKDDEFTLFSFGDGPNLVAIYFNEGTLYGKVADSVIRITALPADKDWHFLVFSEKEGVVSIDGKSYPAAGLSIPSKAFNFGIGAQPDTMSVRVANLRFYNSSATVKNINDSIFAPLLDLNEPKPTAKPTGNTNFWLLDDGLGATHTNNLIGALNGQYVGNPSWQICYNVTIKGATGVLTKKNHLKASFNPRTNNKAYKPFIDLWKVIVKVRNIINATIASQKHGTLQKLGDFYQSNRDITPYAKYVSKDEKFPEYIQTLLLYRFSMDWSEFELDFDNDKPFISSYLTNLFHSNGIELPENAQLTKNTTSLGTKVKEWIISESHLDVYFISLRKKVLDVYKLLPHKNKDNVVHIPSLDGEDLNIPDTNICIGNSDLQKLGDQITKVYHQKDEPTVVVYKRGEYLYYALYTMTNLVNNSILVQIERFISDLGQLLYATNTLDLLDEEFECIDKYKDRFFEDAQSKEFQLFSFEHLQPILVLHKLNTMYQAENKSFAHYFSLPDDRKSLTDYIANLTGWDSQGLLALSDSHYQQFDVSSKTKVDVTPTSVVAVDQGFAIVGVAKDNTAYVYQQKGDSWEMIHVLAPNSLPGESLFGAVVSIGLNSTKKMLTVVVSDTNGTVDRTKNCGVVYVYNYDLKKEKWSDPVLVSASDASKGSSFGASLALESTTLVVGAPKAKTTGKVYVYAFKNNKWNAQDFNPALPDGTTMFGSVLSLEKKTIAVGAAKDALVYNVATAKSLAKMSDCYPTDLATNGKLLLVSCTKDGASKIQYITGLDTTPSEALKLSNTNFTGLCSLALDEDTFIIYDASATCYVYGIQKDTIVAKPSFKISNATSGNDDHALPIALSSDNVVLNTAVINESTIQFYGVKHNIAWFEYVQQCFSLADKLGVSVQFLLGFVKLANTGMQLPNKGHEKANNKAFATYYNYANKLKNAFETALPDGQWETRYTPLQTTFFEQERDALTSYMLYYLRAQFADITSLDDLYELLLIDVSMDGSRTISRIKAALNSLQLFIERCRMHVEPDVVINGSSPSEGQTLNLGDVEWDWMHQYRVWEANREVFLYPENYYDPTLRKDKSQEYADLQNKLSQGNLTDDSANDSYQMYFTELENLASLAIKSYCLAVTANFVNGTLIPTNTYNVFGKIKHSNGNFYYRSAVANKVSDKPDLWSKWANWQKVDISIKSEGVTSIYANNRLFLFWAETTKKQVTNAPQPPPANGHQNLEKDVKDLVVALGASTNKGKSQYGVEKTYVYTMTINYSFQHANGRWTDPRQVPDPNNYLSFLATPAADITMEVSIPDAPELDVLNSFLDIVNLKIMVTVNTGGGTISAIHQNKDIVPSGLLGSNGPSTATSGLILDEVLNLHQRYMWPLNKEGGVNLRVHNPLGSDPGAKYSNSTVKPFINVPVLHLDVSYKGGLKMVGNNYNDIFDGSFSLGIWVYGAFPANGDWPILASILPAQPPTFIRKPNEELSVGIKDGYTYMSFYGNETIGKLPVKPNTWNFIVFQYDIRTATQTIFLNGQRDHFEPNIPPLVVGTDLKGFGLGLSADNLSYAVGQMTEMFLTNEALSDTKIEAIYNQYLDKVTVYNISQSPITKPDENLQELSAIQSTNSKLIQLLNQDLFMGGADYLYANNSPSVNLDMLISTNAYGRYYWELFYHIPMLVAQLLNSNQQFKDAKKWYEYIFNPTSGDVSDDRFWNLGYFRSLGLPEDLVAILNGASKGDQEQIYTYDFNPFDPEAIAYLRPGAFEKKAVMNYIKNLLDWGDSLFSQYTWETMTEAEMLYIIAKELLGKRPEIIGNYEEKPPINLDEIVNEYGDNIPQFLIDIEDMQLGLHKNLKAPLPLSATVPSYYFCIPENSMLPANYDLVATRLYDIRHGLNILGQKQSLALFEPPINPMALVAALASGTSLSDIPINMAGDIPYYRFSKMIETAKSITQRVIDFGRQVLGALEKKDAEALAMLRAVQEQSILNLTTAIKQRNIEELQEQANVLEQNLNSANTRVTHYTNLLSAPISPKETTALDLSVTAIELETPAVALYGVSAVAHLIPTVFGFADGDFQPGSAIESGAQALSASSGLLNSTAGMITTSASYERRSEDWELQLKLAQSDVASITIQQAINNIHLQNAQSDLEVHQQSITNNQNLQDFYTSKFTNQEMYQWMIDQISGVYYQAYSLAFKLAKKAESAYHFELNTNDSIISYGYWDSNRKGLLAGEKLISDLDTLENAYMDNNERYLEIQKVISLKDIDPMAMHDLVTTGSCYINLKEQLYDYDFPGHYNRKIKSLSITIPAVVGPYQTINATLIQQANYVVTDTNVDAVSYLLKGDMSGKGQQPPEFSLRQNWRPNQEIAISKASNDSGLFELNLNDMRYLPFEGTGAVSIWELKIPQASNQFDLKTISDVIFYVNYTAQDGGEEFTQKVSQLPALKDFHGTIMFSLKNQFNKAWNTFINTSNPSSTGEFSLTELQFPANVDASKAVIDNKKSDINVLFVTSDGSVPSTSIYLNKKSNKMNSGTVSAGDKKLATDWKVFTDDNKGVNPAKLLDIVFIIPYACPIKTN